MSSLVGFSSASASQGPQRANSASNTDFIVKTVAPVDPRPARLDLAHFPAGPAARSSTVTCRPFGRERHAAARPPAPAPITTTRPLPLRIP